MISPYEDNSSRQDNAALTHFGDAHPHAVGGATNFSSLALELSLRLSRLSFAPSFLLFLPPFREEYVVLEDIPAKSYATSNNGESFPFDFLK